MDPINTNSQWSHSTLQLIFEEIQDLHAKVAPESLPFVHKYKARELLMNLIANESTLIQEFSHIAMAYTHYLLAINYLESEENSSAEKSFRNALSSFTLVNNPLDFTSILLECYNSLAYLLLNRDEDRLGLGILKKSEALYTLILSKSTENHNEPIEHSLQKLMMTASSSIFKPILASSFHDSCSKKQVETQHTLTLFYLAQAFTKSGDKCNGAKYCGYTMKRQFLTNSYEIKDWSVNCISLAEYYVSQTNFAQAYYLILSALSLLPMEKRKKLRATLEMSMGRVVAEYMKFCISKLTSNFNENLEFLENLNVKILVFDGINVLFPALSLPNSLDDIKSLFRQSHTQLKKALEFFKLDGYVTEHIGILKEISSLYKSLSSLESQRAFAYLEKRKELLEPILTQINPKAYAATWLELAVEVAEICGGMFEFRFTELIENKKKPKTSKIIEMNEIGSKTIEYYKMLLQKIEEENESSSDLIQSEINSRFTIAKTYSHLQLTTKEEQVEALKSSFFWYKSIVEMEPKVDEKVKIELNLFEQFGMCKEMVAMLPLKIDKLINS